MNICIKCNNKDNKDNKKGAAFQVATPLASLPRAPMFSILGYADQASLCLEYCS